MLVIRLPDNTAIGGGRVQLKLTPGAPQRNVQFANGHGPECLQRVLDLARDPNTDLCVNKSRGRRRICNWHYYCYILLLCLCLTRHPLPTMCSMFTTLTFVRCATVQLECKWYMNSGHFQSRDAAVVATAATTAVAIVAVVIRAQV